MGLVLLLVGMVFLGLGYFLGRWAVARASGVRGLQSILGLRSQGWEGISLARRLATSASGFVGYYLAAALILAIGAYVGGETLLDDSSMRVNVGPDGPAARAGMRSGDRVVSVGGAAVGDWDSLKRAVAAHAGEPVAVVVERDGAPLTLTVTPAGEGPGRGKILVGPPFTRREVGLGAALGSGLGQPFRIVAASARGFGRLFSGAEKPELAGPVAIVSEANRATRDGPGDAFRLVGALASYFFFIALLASLLTIPRAPAR